LVAAANKSGLTTVYGSYPITPASDILHTLSRYKNHNVITIQAEDEIAAVGIAIGAAFGGSLGITGTSGPGIALKGEAMGLAHIIELPLVIVNVQRGGPSTGLPTKTEQSDLMQALYGRNGDAPIPIIAASTPGDCFITAYEACRIAVKYMTPVLLLSDGYLANGSEPWLIPDEDDLKPFDVTFAEKTNHVVDDQPVFWPYLRDKTTLARPWAKPGTAGLEHRVGGLEKQDGSGNVNYEADNHEFMVRIRAEKIQRIQAEIPPLEIYGDPNADLLIVGWGSTRGAIEAGVSRALKAGQKVASIHLRFLNPFPKDLGEVLSRFNQHLVPELNNGQLVKVLRSEFLLPMVAMNKIQGRPFGPSEIAAKIAEMVG